MKPMPVTVDRNISKLTSEAAASAKSEPAKPPVDSRFAASIADVGNADEELRTLKNCFQVTANVQAAFSQWLASSN